jgi:hypothetical protein
MIEVRDMLTTRCFGAETIDLATEIARNLTRW